MVQALIRLAATEEALIHDHARLGLPPHIQGAGRVQLHLAINEGKGDPAIEKRRKDAA